MDTRDGWLRIGDVAERTGLSAHTLRFYEREGLHPFPIRRDAAGRRVYDEDDVEWLGICSTLRSSGMPVPEIRRYAELVAAGPGNEAERFDVLRRHQRRVTEQLAELNRCLATISFKVDYYRRSMDAGTAATLWTGEAPRD